MFVNGTAVLTLKFSAISCLERVQAKRVCRSFAKLLGNNEDEQVHWIRQLRSANAKYSAANCFDRVRHFEKKKYSIGAKVDGAVLK
jgi:hypothetical protein